MGNFPWTVAWEILLPWAIGDAIGLLIVPPLLVPLLFWVLEEKQSKAAFLDWPSIGFQVLTILVAMFVAFWAAQQSPNLGSLWYVILLPPVVFAVRGGLHSAATATALTTLLTPPAAYLLGFEGERIALQFLLLVSAGISLMIGAAITDRKRAFQAVKDSEEHLEQQVKDRTKDLLAAYEFQQHLVRSIGHDLRQPVVALNMMLDGLVVQHKGTSSSVPLEQARNIGQTASGFIDNVLIYAKREAGRIEPINTDFALQKVLDQIAHTFGSDAEARGVSLEIRSTNTRMNSDANLVWEALSNLVQNAVRMSGNGQSVQIYVETNTDALVLIVTDGIVAQNAEPGQAGFGLEIVRQITRILNGELELRPNRATITFKI